MKVAFKEVPQIAQLVSLPLPFASYLCLELCVFGLSAQRVPQL